MIKKHKLSAFLERNYKLISNVDVLLSTFPYIDLNIFFVLKKGSLVTNSFNLTTRYNKYLGFLLFFS